MSEAVIDVKEKKPRLQLGDWMRRNPVMVKELRSRMRGRRAFIILTIYLFLLSSIVSMVYLTYLSSISGPMGSAEERRMFGKVIFGVVVWMELLTASFIAPALTAGSISSEREHQTYDLLRTTLLPARSLVLGKFLSGMLFILLLLFAALPLQSLAFLFGGVALSEVVIGTLLLIVTSAAFCAVGVFFSSFLSRTLISTVLSYGFAILLVFGLPMLLIFSIYLIMLSFNGQLSSIQEVILLVGGWVAVSTNPLSTIIASEAILLEQQSAWYFNLPLSNGVTFYMISPWISYTVLYLILCFLLLWMSVLMVKRAER